MYSILVGEYKRRKLKHIFGGLFHQWELISKHTAPINYLTSKYFKLHLVY